MEKRETVQAVSTKHISLCLGVKSSTLSQIIKAKEAGAVP